MNRTTLSFPLRGFTLIELLVVIAIVGILSAVVLDALNTARSKGADSSVKSNLQGLRSQAELFANNNNYDYAGGTGIVSASACPTSQPSNSGSNFSVMGDANFYKSVVAADAAGFCSYITGTGFWAVAVELKEQVGKAWCVDSFGNSKITTNGSLQSGVTAYTQSALNAEVGSTGCGN